MMFEKQVVVLTGASRGIGLATAHLFAQKGAHLVCGYGQNDSDQKTAEALLSEISDKVVWLKGDVRDAATTDALCQCALDTWGTVDIAVANAGVALTAPFHRLTDEDAQTLIGVNQMGVYYLLRAAGKIMKKNKQGCVVTLSSVFASKVAEHAAFYGATKAFVETLTKGFALEYSRHGVRANSISPGVIDTEMNRVAKTVSPEGLNERSLSHRMGTPEEVAQAICFLASPDASYINGQVLNVDGGTLTGL